MHIEISNSVPSENNCFNMFAILIIKYFHETVHEKNFSVIQEYKTCPRYILHILYCNCRNVVILEHTKFQFVHLPSATEARYLLFWLISKPVTKPLWPLRLPANQG